MTFSTSSATPAAPSTAAQAAYVDAVAPSRALLSDGIIARMPFLGCVMLDRRGASAPESRAVGVCVIGLGRVELSAYMPDREDRFQIAEGAKARMDLPWRLIGVPLLSVALALKVAHHAVFGPGRCRLHRLHLRLMWRLRPETMARKLSSREESGRVEAAAYRRIEEEWNAAEAAREAEREAVFEAEVERRLALRLASAGA